MRSQSGARWLMVQWLALTGMMAVLIYRIAFDLAGHRHDDLLVLWVVLAALAFISATATGFALWRIRSRSLTVR
jgi:hypothetical protein